MNRTIGVSVLAGLLAACSPGDQVAEDAPKEEAKVKAETSGGKAEAWSSADNPGIFSPNLEYRVSELPMTGEAQAIPWASSYWPVYQDGINFKWDGASSESTAAKYGRAFGVAGVEDAVSTHHGIEGQRGARKACTADSECDAKIAEKCAKRSGQSSGVCIPTWWGICHAWAPAAVLLPEAKYPVTRNGVTFKVNDIKALVSLVHNQTDTRFVSLRCNEDLEAGEVAFDNYGRPTADDAECRDSNAGTYHVLLTNYLGRMRQSFVEDRTIDDEVWNQPLRGYSITKMQEVTAAQANALIGVTAVGGTTVNRSGQAQQGAWSHQGSFPVTAGQTFKVVMTANGDGDLYVNFGAQPTAQAYACRPYLPSGNETCELPVPAGATQAFVSVHGYAAVGFNLAITTGASAPVQYAFNANATKFYDVALTVKYISESASTQDGNLAATIDRYTHEDKYEYILEVDSAGRVVGGEWLRDSKKNHPDFLWLPTGVRGASVAGGKVTYANVKSLLDESLVPPGGGGGSDQVVTDAGTLAKDQWKTYGPYDVAAGGSLEIAMTGSGDADVYARRGAAPTLTAHDCRPYLEGTNEACTLTGPGQVYVSIHGYAASSSFSITIRNKGGAGGGGGTQPPPAFTHLETTGSVALGEMKIFDLPIPAGKKVVVRTTAGADVDVYLQMNQAPTTSSYLMRGYTSSGNETVTYTATQSGTLRIGVHGYRASSFTLRTADF